jgi:hypothetical protein
MTETAIDSTWTLADAFARAARGDRARRTARAQRGLPA